MNEEAALLINDLIFRSLGLLSKLSREEVLATYSTEGDEGPELTEEGAEIVQTVIDNLGDNTEEFLEEYRQATDEERDALLTPYLGESEMTLAKLGGKLDYLKKLKSGGSVSKKCSCGCDLVFAKEKGGKIVSKCACGCNIKQEGGKVEKASIIDKKKSDKIKKLRGKK